MSHRLIAHLEKLILKTSTQENVKKAFLKRISKGLTTRDENPTSHLCIYFAGHDPKAIANLLYTMSPRKGKT